MHFSINYDINFVKNIFIFFSGFVLIKILLPRLNYLILFQINYIIILLILGN